MHPYAVGVTATYVYWTTAWPIAGDPPTSVMRVPLDGGPSEVLATGPNLHSLVLDATNLYWTDFSSAGAIFKMPLAGGAVVTLASHEDSPHGLAVDQSYVYWTDFVLQPGTTGKVRKVPKDGGTVTPLADNLPSPVSLAVDGEFVYWTSLVSQTGTIMRAPLDGSSAPVVIAANQDEPYDIVIDHGTLYWTNEGGGEIMRMPADAGQPPVPLASGQVQPYGLVLDDTSAYWTNYVSLSPETGDGAIRKVPRDGGPWTELARADSYDLAIDGTSVYFTTYDVGDAGPGGAGAAGTVVRLTPR